MPVAGPVKHGRAARPTPTFAVVRRADSARYQLNKVPSSSRFTGRKARL
jgi:hypothetical protein